MSKARSLPGQQLSAVQAYEVTAPFNLQYEGTIQAAFDRGMYRAYRYQRGGWVELPVMWGDPEC
jgi:hypothetical protein